MLFVVGSVGYLITAVCDLLGVYSYECSVANFWVAVLFVFDSFFYLFALRKGAKSRATRQGSFGYASPNSCMLQLYFKSDYDWYIIATFVFILGSFLYLFAAYEDFYEADTTLVYLFGAIIFSLDAIFYLLSGYQVREEDFEKDIRTRKNVFIIEYFEEAGEVVTDPSAPHFVE